MNSETDEGRPERPWDSLEKGQKPPREWVREQLMTPQVSNDTYAEAAAYQAALMDQYKTYVEMADRISARRGLTNTFFLTLNSAVFTVIGVFWKDAPPEPSGAIVAVLLAVALAQCGAWYFIVRSYRQLNSAKYDVIGMLEEQLPASPYYAAEWAALKHGTDWRVYWPLTHVEQWVPILFGTIYIIGALLVVVG